MIINVADYWPQYFAPRKGAVRFDYGAVEGFDAFSQVFYYDGATNAMKLASYDKNNMWMNNWYLQNKVDRGVVEIQDDLPQKNKYLAMIFGNIIVERYDEPILWGNTVEIGSIVSNRPKMSFFRSSPPQTGTGFQAVAFEQVLSTFTTSFGATHKNVLVQMYQQTWQGGTTSGARMWLAKGVGPVANQWVVGDVTSPRQDATVTFV